MNRIPCPHEQIKQRKEKHPDRKGKGGTPKSWLKVTKVEKGRSEARNTRSLQCNLEEVRRSPKWRHDRVKSDYYYYCDYRESWGFAPSVGYWYLTLDTREISLVIRES